MTHSKTRLTFVDEPVPGASILEPDVEPAFHGEGSEDLLCGSCGATISSGVSAQAIAQNFHAPIELLVKCPVCETLNRLSAQFVH